MIESLLHGSTWSDSYVKETVFISRQLLQPSITTSGLWLIWEKLKGMSIWGKTLKLSESVTTESLDNFLKGSKNGFHGNALADFKTYVLQVWFIWEVKIKDTYHLQSWRQLAFQQMWKCFYSIMICTDTDNYVKVLSTIKKETKNLCSFKVANLFHRTSCSNCEKYCVKCTKALPAIPFMWVC